MPVSGHSTNMTSKSDQTALLGVVLAAALTVFVVPGAWGWISCCLGVTLLLIIVAYDCEEDKSWLHLLAFSAVFGMCFLLATGVFLEWALKVAGCHAPPQKSYSIVIEGHKYDAVSSETESRLGEAGTAVAWFIYGFLGTVYAGIKRGKWHFLKKKDRKGN